MAEPEPRYHCRCVPCGKDFIANSKHHRVCMECVETNMVKKLVEAIYPVLIPMEQQSVQIQERNHKRMTELATWVWRDFQKPQQ